MAETINACERITEDGGTSLTMPNDGESQKTASGNDNGLKKSQVGVSQVCKTVNGDYLDSKTSEFDASRKTAKKTMKAKNQLIIVLEFKENSMLVMQVKKQSIIILKIKKWSMSAQVKCWLIVVLKVKELLNLA